MKKMYIDSNVFLFSVLYDDEKASAARSFLSDIVDCNIEAVTSVLTWDEFCYVVQRTLGKEIALEEADRFLHFPNLKFEPCDLILLSKAQRIMKDHGLDPRDAIHAATAFQTNSHTILSDDRDFEGIDGLERMPLDANIG